MTIKRIIGFVILVPVAIVLVAFLVANRAIVTLTLNPFNGGDSSLTYRAPFFVWLFLFLAIGIILSGIFGWLNQRKYRKALREAQAELDRLKANLPTNVN